MSPLFAKNILIWGSLFLIIGLVWKTQKPKPVSLVLEYVIQGKEQLAKARKSGKTAVIIEPRRHPNLPLVIHNVRESIPGFTIQLFHGTENADFVSEHFASEINSGHIVAMQMQIENLTLRDYNHLLLTREFWEDYIQGEHILLFETDAGVCAKESDLEGFFAFDYIGAPFKVPISCSIYHDSLTKQNYVVTKDKDIKSVPGYSQFIKRGPYQAVIGNSGLSLRKRSAVVRLLKDYFPVSPYVRDLANDAFYACVLHDINSNVKIPDVMTAKRFSVESLFYEAPFGFHKPWKHLNSNEFAKLKVFCPILERISAQY